MRISPYDYKYHCKKSFLEWFGEELGLKKWIQSEGVNYKNYSEYFRISPFDGIYHIKQEFLDFFGSCAEEIWENALGKTFIDVEKRRVKGSDFAYTCMQLQSLHGKKARKLWNSGTLI